MASSKSSQNVPKSVKKCAARYLQIGVECLTINGISRAVAPQIVMLTPRACWPLARLTRQSKDIHGSRAARDIATFSDYEILEVYEPGRSTEVKLECGTDPAGNAVRVTEILRNIEIKGQLLGEFL